MAYTPPATNALDFSLKAYTPVALNAENFEFSTVITLPVGIVSESDSALAIVRSKSLPVMGHGDAGTNPITDTFNRIDESPLTDSGKWTRLWGLDGTNDLRVISNQVQTQAGAAPECYEWRTDQLLLDCEVVLTIRSLASGWAGVWARSGSDGSGHGFLGRWGSNGAVAIMHFGPSPGSGSGLAQLLSVATGNAPISGDKIALRCVGSRVTVLVYRAGAWAEIGTVPDPAPVAGYSGIYLWGTDLTADDFSVGAAPISVSETDVALSVAQTKKKIIGIATEIDSIPGPDVQPVFPFAFKADAYESGGAAPGQGYFQVDHPLAQNTTTLLCIDADDENGRSDNDYLDTWDGTIIVTKRNDPGIYLYFDIIAVSDMGGSIEYTCTVADASSANPFSDFDEVDIQGWPVGQHAESKVNRLKTRALGVANETDASLAVTAAFTHHGLSATVDVANETDAALAVTHSKAKALGTNAETDAALAVSSLKARSVGIVNETDSPYAVTRSKTRALGVNTETDGALAITRIKSRGIDLDTEIESALGITALKTRAIGCAVETDAPLALTHARAKAIDIVTETDAALAIARVRSRALGVANETDTPLVVSRNKARSIGMATEADEGFSVTRVRSRTLGVVSETDSAYAVAHARTYAIGVATEVDVAHDIRHAKVEAVGIAAETDNALPIGSAKSLAVGLATEVDSAPMIIRHVLGLQQVVIDTAVEVDEALAPSRKKSRVIGISVSTELALTIHRVKTRALGVANEADEALRIAIVHRVGLASETDQARSIKRIKTVTLGIATETEFANALTRNRHRTLNVATEADLSYPIHLKVQRLIHRVIESDTANAVRRIKVKALGLAIETDAVFSVARVKTRHLGTANEADVAHKLIIPKIRMIHQVHEVDNALRIIAVRSLTLGTALEQSEAMAFKVCKSIVLGMTREHDKAGRIIFLAPSGMPPGHVAVHGRMGTRILKIGPRPTEKVIG